MHADIEGDGSSASSVACAVGIGHRSSATASAKRSKDTAARRETRIGFKDLSAVWAWLRSSAMIILRLMVCSMNGQPVGLNRIAGQIVCANNCPNNDGCALAVTIRHKPMTGDNPGALMRLKAHTLHAGEALRRHEKLRQVSYRRGIPRSVNAMLGTRKRPMGQRQKTARTHGRTDNLDS